jgi:hypothetical protein
MAHTPGYKAGIYNTVARLHRTYNSFSGVDIQATFAGLPIGELQGISYTVTREKAPLYTMGSPDPRAFSRGKRGIAGSLIFLVFDRSNLLEAMGDRAFFWADNIDLTYLANYTQSKIGESTVTLGLNANTPWGRPAVTVGSEYVEGEEARVGTVTRARAWYHDQILPFDIVLTALNEYGHAARMIIRGVEILNAGSGISIDDITTDENMTFVAKDILPWHSLGFASPNTMAFQTTPRTESIT